VSRRRRSAVVFDGKALWASEAIGNVNEADEAELDAKRGSGAVQEPTGPLSVVSQALRVHIRHPEAPPAANAGPTPMRGVNHESLHRIAA
jgi:hypothetical protein